MNGMLPKEVLNMGGTGTNALRSDVDETDDAKVDKKLVFIV